MKLEVHERIKLLDLLPQQGHYAELKDMRKHREMFSFTDEELKRLNFRNEGGALAWDLQQGQEVVRDIPISEFVTSMIRNILAQMEMDGKLTDDTFSLYEKFVVAYQ